MKFRYLCLILITASSVCAQSPATVDETARFLAGLPVNGALASLAATPAWQQHAAEMDQAWEKKQTQRITPIREWMWNNAEPYFRSSGTMYYMFAGPDFLYANIFFPYANTYILAGLEPVGQVPDITRLPPEYLAAELSILRGSMNSILRFQYFITKDMRADLGRGGGGGTLSILYVFLARLGYNILDVTPVKSPAEGVKITFRDPERAQTQTLYYFKTDLSGGGSSAFLKWCAARGPGLSLLKAASFLMHGDGFTGVRNFLLDHSRVILQDDSGIPLRAFPKGWNVHCYGRYIQHNETFAKYYQPELAALYQRSGGSELGFAFGYHWQREAGMLMLATPGGGRESTEKMPPIMKALPVTPEEQAEKPRIRE
jgi:hypothetical protein